MARKTTYGEPLPPQARKQIYSDTLQTFVPATEDLTLTTGPPTPPDAPVQSAQAAPDPEDADATHKRLADAIGKPFITPAEARKKMKAEPIEERPFVVGDAVKITGRITQIQSIQGGMVSVLVQTSNGAIWLRGEDLQRD